MPFTSRLSRRLALLYSMIAVLSCDLQRRTGPPPVSALDRIVVSPSVISIPTNRSVDLAAVGLSVSGDTNNVPVFWRVTGGGLTDTFSLGRVRYGRYRSRLPGNFLIIVSAPAGTLSDTATVIVRDVVVSSVLVTPAAMTLVIGSTTQLTAIPRDSSGTSLSGRTVTWTSSLPAVASVNSSGLVTALTAGSTTFTATCEGTTGSAAMIVTVVPVASVSVSPASADISEGGEVQLIATPRDGAGNPLSGRAVTWSSDVPSVAVVTGTGRVIAGAAGSATISATSETKSGSAAITVTLAPVASVTVNPAAATVLVGGTVQLTAIPMDGAGKPLSGRVVTWASSAPAVATVNGSGLVTTLTAGSATLTATSEGISGPATITVTLVPVASVTMTPVSAGVPVGGTIPLTATPRDGAGAPLTGRVITWASSAPGVATVDGNGLVTGVTAGSLTITATSEGKSGSASIAVTAAPVASVTVTPASGGVRVGGTIQLTATPKDGAGAPLSGRVITWASSAPGVASVNASGLVTGVAPGSATLTATSETKSGSATIAVTVVPVTTVAVTPASASALVGGTAQLTATPKDSVGGSLSGRVVTWVSSAPAVATVDGNGLVTGVTAGPATITATSETKSGSSAITITVVPVASVTVAPASGAIRVGATIQLTATPKDGAGAPLTGRVITWASSAPGVASVNGSGLVTGVAPGSATLTATSEAQTGSATISVTLAPVASVTVTPASATIPVLGIVQLTATLRDSLNKILTGRIVTWVSSAPAAGSVNGSGLVSGVAPGATTVTATSEGKSGSSSITIPTPLPPPPPPPPVGLCTDVVAPGVPAALRTFYVDAATGNDAADGLTPATAWRTLGKANGVARAGDLFLLSGTFTNQVVHPASSGTALAKIVYRAKPGAAAAISGGMYQVIVWLDGVSHIVVDGLELSNESEAVDIRYGANNIWLRNLYIHNAGTGVSIVTATDNRIEDSRIERIGSEAANAGEGIFVQNGAHRNVIVRNTIAYAGHGTIWISYQNAAEATSDDNVIESNDLSNPWASGLGLNGKTNRTIVQCNKIHDTANGSGVNYARAGVEVEGTGNILRFNEIYRSGAEGLTIQGRTFAAFVQNAVNNQIYNNTFWQNGGPSLQFFVNGVANVQNNIIENNIFWHDAGFADHGARYAITADLYHATNPWVVTTLNGNIVRNNLFPTGQDLLLVIRQGLPNESYPLTQAQVLLAGWASNLQTDPLFVNEAGGDVHLRPRSPAIAVGHGVTAIPHRGTRPTLGAHEPR